MPLVTSSRPSRRSKQAVLPGIAREDSDDELGVDDHPWEWIYADIREASPAGTPSRKRKRAIVDLEPRIVGARMGSFVCRVGDIVLLKAETTGEAWVAIIRDFLEDEEGEMAADFLWFSSEKEIRNKHKKRTDFLWNELYVTPNSDLNPLAAINGRAKVMSAAAFQKLYPSGKVPRSAKDHGKVFVCRRGCNTRTATYTDEFVWEDVYQGADDIHTLEDLVEGGTKATRKHRQARQRTPDDLYDVNGDGDAEERGQKRTPRKPSSHLGTPKKPRSASKPVTPSSHRKVVLKKHLEFTPLATRVLSPSHHQSSPFQLARANLHVASVPTSLPCREAEFSLVYSHLEAAIIDGMGTCIYISGTPGTGKTATVREVVYRLDESVRSDELDDFIFVEINGMKITDPHQAYSLLWEALKGQRVSPAQALDLLEREFSHPSPRRVPCVVLMDELDQLVTKNQGVMYNFFNWPGLRHSRLIVLAVANTMDLPERTLSNKISSRLGLTRITFPGYNHEQLMKIVQSRLEGVPGNIVEPDAIQFASRKVAAVSGDARRALDICRRAVELAEVEAKSADSTSEPSTPSKRQREKEARGETSSKKKNLGRVTIDTVRRAINEATSSPLQQYLRTLPFASRLLLSALLARTQRTGLAESTYGDVLEEMQRSLKLAADSRQLGILEKKARPGGGNAWETKTRRDVKGVRLAGLGAAAVDLTGAGIINLEAQKAERPSKIRLAVGDDEVRLAFRDDPEIKAMGLIV
ncbi:origin recognition complex subunit 1 [Diaporthe helianthi]|uniref:Origin recognition complex subunit 1 n=1 Tax=Diaporthe helianthi TaxID=158607 RepID=A0A2P5ID40_DIAHE|nr:origin recognition complex subunit 1 [Diaporthe helianthi]